MNIKKITSYIIIGFSFLSNMEYATAGGIKNIKVNNVQHCGDYAQESKKLKAQEQLNKSYYSKIQSRYPSSKGKVDYISFVIKGAEASKFFNQEKASFVKQTGINLTCNTSNGNAACHYIAGNDKYNVRLRKGQSSVTLIAPCNE